VTTVQAPTKKRRTSPLLYPAAFLSLASLAWTTWSLVDLLGTGLIALTVAAGADIIWGSVIIAEARGLRVAGKPWIVPAFGWATLLVVASFLALHGVEKNSLAMAAAGPFLPFGAKAIWVLAIADLRDPAALTDDEKHQLARMERGMVFDEAKHRIEMRQREMGAELLMTEVSTDFDIELMRQDRVRELTRRRPLELTAGDADEAHRITHHLPAAPHASDATAALNASAAPHAPLRPGRDRTDAFSEAAAHTREAPQMPTAPQQAEALRNGDAALHLDGLSKAAAVRVVRDALPTASAPQIVERLAHHGIDATDAYVRTVLSRKKQRGAGNGGYL
jgi:hypothetical protein